MQFLHGMDSVRDFIRNVNNVVASIPDDAGEHDANGMMKTHLANVTEKIQRSLETAPGEEVHFKGDTL